MAKQNQSKNQSFSTTPKGGAYKFFLAFIAVIIILAMILSTIHF
ncbi:MAG: hypothetical protein VB108_00010 [Anaerolineaceae bacterium]|nr:hypothetical protein [Anaerolineaceae bacterium]